MAEVFGFIVYLFLALLAAGLCFVLLFVVACMVIIGVKKLREEWKK